MRSQLTRKQFLQTSLWLIGGSSIVFGLAGCSDDDDSGTGGSSGAGGAGGSSGTGGTSGTGGASGAGGTAGASGTAGKGGSGGSGATSCSADVSTVEMHTHTLMVPAADAAAGTEKSYTTGITDSHSHMVTITAAEFQMLAGGQTVTKPTTTVSLHAHQVTVMCS